MRQNSKGFGVIELIVIIAVVALIGLVVWKAWEAYSESRVDPGLNQQQKSADSEAPDIKSSSDLDTATEALDAQTVEGDEAQKVDAETSF